MKYPDRMGGLLEFGDSKEGDGLPSKGDSLKQILQTVKETVIRTAFVWICLLQMGSGGGVHVDRYINT